MMSHTQHLKGGKHTTQAWDVCNRRLNLPKKSSKPLQNFNSVSIGFLVSISGCCALGRSCALSCGDAAVELPTGHNHSDADSDADAESDAACDIDLDADSAAWGREDCNGYCVRGRLGGREGGWSEGGHVGRTLFAAWICLLSKICSTVMGGRSTTCVTRRMPVSLPYLIIHYVSAGLAGHMTSLRGRWNRYLGSGIAQFFSEDDCYTPFNSHQ